MNAYHKMHQKTLHQKTLSADTNFADIAIESYLETAFKQSGYHRLELLDCEVRNGNVTLNGKLDTFHLSQMAQTIAWKTDGVESVENNIFVVPYS